MYPCANQIPLDARSQRGQERMKKAAQQDAKASMIVKPEVISVAAHPDENEEFIEIEEEPNSGGPQEEWEKDIPPFLRKLSTMVNENRDIHSTLHKYFYIYFFVIVYL
jgi:hypothetical protein